ncbi:hypothetical protein U9M48_021834 [Paspalum notatum var. saurae]|uniref:Uncharacterized protein n=1 Tax=Paspalum notatum var. saurae TaxID=547442 RepID=A0AAQ3WTD2_PASNO
MHEYAQHYSSATYAPIGAAHFGRGRDRRTEGNRSIDGSANHSCDEIWKYLVDVVLPWMWTTGSSSCEFGCELATWVNKRTEASFLRRSRKAAWCLFRSSHGRR